MKTPRARARRFIVMAVVLGALVALAVLAGVGFAASSSSSSAAYQYQYGNKVTICHHTHSQKHPFVTITVSQNALKAHLAHGDTIGPCTGGVLGVTASRSSGRSGSSGGGVLGATATSSSLPFTGLGLLGVVLLGALTLGTGLALRRSSRA